jgi:hypothetical protein
VRGRIAAEFADLGEKALKNIAEPVRAYVLAADGVAATKISMPATPALPARRTRAFAPAAVLAALLILLAAGA